MALYFVPDSVNVWSLANEAGDQPSGLTKFYLVGSRKMVQLDKKQCMEACEGSDAGMPDDLIKLPQVNQATILHCARLRYTDSLIYTNIGQVLMVINPFFTIQGLYGPTVMDRFRSPSNATPHVYGVASRAYTSMLTSGKNQSLLISGESGAGKTEATKQCLSMLTAMAGNGGGGSSSSGKADRGAMIAKRILAASPVLEAFGNAQTVRNPNSSRFGKWMELKFDPQAHFAIFGSHITSYLLEKSRVTTRDCARERNFHVFYQLLLGASSTVLESLHLDADPQKFLYLSSSSTSASSAGSSSSSSSSSGGGGGGWNKPISAGAAEARSVLAQADAVEFPDAQRHGEMLDALTELGFSEDDVKDIFQIVAAVLLLGNVEFLAKDGGESSAVALGSSGVGALHVAELLAVTEESLSFSLCNQILLTGGKQRRSATTKTFTPAKAIETRDSLSRALYDLLFKDIIERFNSKNRVVASAASSSKAGRTGEQVLLHSDESSSSPARQEVCIGLLDIFGFEIFKENSFEQLCINYCNEALQSHFNMVIFTAERDLYAQEGIHCDTIEFKDNQGTIKEIEDLFKGLDEEARIPKGNSKTWYV